MPTDVPIASPERDQTDESLREEREKTDRALAETNAGVESDAGHVVESAREHADALLEAARRKADGKIQMATIAAIAEERKTEDRILQSERERADEKVALERKEVERLHAMHLEAEREATDEHLQVERESADQALAYRDDFLGMVCHDLRDLLGGIVNGANVLSQKARADEEGRLTLAVTARIQRSAARMNRLISDLVDVAGIDAGKLSVNRTADDAVTLIGEALDTLHAGAAEKGISLETGELARCLPALFDHGRLLQVLVNLITNSIKFTPAGGSIRVSCRRSGDALEFCVADTGEGIPAGMLEAVFERFRQVERNDRRGLGLGLYISKSIVEAHGGTIRAESGPPGTGTQIVFTLPVD